jgi:RNA polymerase sigma-70 factor (sigma-E family)
VYLWQVREKRAPVVTADGLRRAYQEHWERLVRLCTLLTGDEATGEDIVQDVFIRARERLGQLPDEQVYLYLRRATINGWLNVLRRQRRERSAVVRLGDVESEDPTTAVAEHDAMWSRIGELPPRQRAAIVLRFYEDLPDRQIAQLLGCSRVTVRSQIKRGLAKLREAIEG